MGGLEGASVIQFFFPSENNITFTYFFTQYFSPVISNFVISQLIILALQKSTDGSVLIFLMLPSNFSHQNSLVGEFWCTMVIMQDQQQNSYLK